MLRALVVVVAVVAVVVVVAAAGGCKHLEPVMDKDGGEIATATIEYPKAAWLPLQHSLGQHQLDVVVIVEGKPAVATLDTGATRTSMSASVAERLGLDERASTSTMKFPFVDAHGYAGVAVGVDVESLAVGNEWLEHQTVWVYPGNTDTFLIGMDLLQHYEILIAADQGFVALLPLGTGPRDADINIPLQIADNGALVVAAAAAGDLALARASMIVDTGATSTMFPSVAGVTAGVPADLRMKGVTVAVASEQVQHGSFRIDHFLLGGVDVGAVLARENLANGGQGPGLVGADVFMRFRTLIVTRGEEPALHLWRLPPRHNTLDVGPGAQRCPAGCVRVAVNAPPQAPPAEVQIADIEDRMHDMINAMAEDAIRGGDGTGLHAKRAAARHFLVPAESRADGACLSIHVDGAYGGSRLEMIIVDDSDAPGGLFAGHVLTAQVSVPAAGFNECLPLPAITEALGVGVSTPLALRFVRTDAAIVDRCDADGCLRWSGP